MATAAWTDSKELGDGPQADVPYSTHCSALQISVSAIQLTHVNKVAVITWVRSRGGRAAIARGGVALMDPRRETAPPKLASTGDWVVSIQNSFVIFTDEAFGAMFKVPKRRRREP